MLQIECHEADCCNNVLSTSFFDKNNNDNTFTAIAK